MPHVTDGGHAPFLQIDGTSVARAVEQWWEGRGDASAQVRLDMGYVCRTSCCRSTLLLGGGLFAWVHVLENG